MFIFQNRVIKRVGFLGFGKSNEGVYKYIKKHHPKTHITLRTFKNENYGVSCDRRFAEDDMLRDIDEDILFLSPSVRRDREELTSAESRGVMLSSDSELYFSLTNSDVYAVTGSDGKSTTASLTSALLAGAYKETLPCGNIGEALSPHIDDTDSAHITELSSFQLMYQKPKSRRAVITNISKNHLNWHKSYGEYISAKRNIFENASEMVINFDCDITRNIGRDFDIFAVFSRRHSEEELRGLISAEVYITENRGIIYASGKEMLDTANIRLVGGHNIYNFMAAIAMSYGMCEPSHILNTAECFTGLAHRCELVISPEGKRCYDSSIDSSPTRCINTLESFAERVVLILGGRSKGLDFSPLIPTLIRKTKRIILTGECANEIECILENDSAFFESRIPFYRVDDFHDAVTFALNIADKNDAVLLSPAATSYDRFKNFEERGDAFKRIVKDS